MKPPVPFALSGEFLQLIADTFWNAGNTPRTGPIAEAGIHPERPHHFDKVGLSRTIEAADPNRRLLRLVQVLDVGFENVNNALLILAFANKGFQFVPENGK